MQAHLPPRFVGDNNCQHWCVSVGAGCRWSVSEEEERVVTGGEVAESPEGRHRRDEQGTQQEDQENFSRVTPRCQPSVCRVLTNDRILRTRSLPSVA